MYARQVPSDVSDLHAMIDALSNVSTGLDRTWPRTKGASLVGLLEVIANHDGISPSAIAERLAVHGSTVARHVRESEDAGLVSVDPDPADRRSLLVTLESAGREELRRIVDLRRARLAPLLDGWEPDDLRALTRLLEKLRISIGTVAAPEPLSRRRRSARGDSGHPDWLIQWLGG